MKKQIVILAFALLFCLIVPGCSEIVDETYVSESGKYTVKLRDKSECTWYENGHFYNGTYERTKTGYRLEIEGSGLSFNTVFEMVKDGKDYVVTGGFVYQERFLQQR